MAQGDSWVAPVLFPPGNFAEFWADRVTRCRVTCVTLWKPTSVPRPASLVSHATGRSIFNVTRKGVFAKMLPPLVVTACTAVAAMAQPKKLGLQAN